MGIATVGKAFQPARAANLAEESPPQERYSHTWGVRPRAIRLTPLAGVDFYSMGAAKKILGLAKLIANGSPPENYLNAGRLAVVPDASEREHLASPSWRGRFFYCHTGAQARHRPNSRKGPAKRSPFRTPAIISYRSPCRRSRPSGCRSHFRAGRSWPPKPPSRTDHSEFPSAPC